MAGFLLRFITIILGKSMSSKSPNPRCKEALEKYYHLKERLHNYFFKGVELAISHSDSIAAYSDVYNMIHENGQLQIKNEKVYQCYEETYFDVFKQDMRDFCQQVLDILVEKKSVSSPVEQLGYYYTWINNYMIMLRWTHKFLSCIEKNLGVFSRTTLFHSGLQILRDQLISVLEADIFRLVVRNLEMYKQGTLQETAELQFIIEVIGMCGFEKYYCIKLEKDSTGLFKFQSINKQHNKTAEISYETDFFHRKFVVEYVKYVKNKYNKVAMSMLQLSTPQYVQKSIEYLQQQQKAAQNFYNNSKVKTVIIRSIEETLVAAYYKQLIENPKSGLAVMVDAEDSDGITNLYALTKRVSMQKVFANVYQECIVKHISEQILGKVTPEQQKMAKKQTVAAVIDGLYNYALKIEKLTSVVMQKINDSQDLLLLTVQTNGFQQACNKNNMVCNFLAFYSDTVLKKQASATDNNLKELTVKISKLVKFLYSLDQFLKVYQRMLGIRILYDAYKNKQTENQIINLFKKQVGLGSMAKIMTMVQDYKFSQNFNAEKSALFRGSVAFNFHVTLITSGAWQVQDLKSNKKLVPPELMGAVSIFQKQYELMYPGREITWVFNYGRAIVQVKMNDNTKLLLLLNNYQLLVLLYLQRRGFKPVKLLQVITEVKPEDEAGLLTAIMMLVKKGVLTKQGNPTKIQSKNEVICLNLDLKLKVPKLGCFEVPRYAERVPALNNQLNIQRAFVIQANIVKLMKMKRVLKYQEIIPEVMAMCKNFKAEISMIKNQIEHCIQKDFLERDPKEFNTLIYKP